MSNMTLCLRSRSLGKTLIAGLCLLPLITHSPLLAQAQVGTVYAWGNDIDGELGDGITMGIQVTPVTVLNLSDIVQVDGGKWHTLAVKKDGTVWAWGYNQYGQLGDGSMGTYNKLAFQVKGLSNVAQVSAGYHQSLALKADGTVWAWGNNDQGQLGDGTTISRRTPVQVSGLTNVTYISSGNNHCLAIKSDGTVWGWGYNSLGQVGDGTSISPNVPVQVKGLTNMVNVCAGDGHSVGVRKDGTVWAWGSNNAGQLGIGSTTNQRTAQQVKTLSNCIQAVAADGHSLALKADGTVYGWGYNVYGEVGDGSNTDRHAPVQTIGITGAIQIVAGGGMSYALMPDGTLQSWGLNLLGQLGDGDIFNSATPVPVVTITGQTYISSGWMHGLSLTAVKQASSVTLQNLTATYGNRITLSATLKNGGNGIPLVMRTLNFAIDGVSVGSGRTDASGTATITTTNAATFGVGSHTLTASLKSDPLYTDSTASATLTLTKADTTLTTSTFSGRPGDKKSLTATLKRNSDGAVVSTKTLTFKVDGTKIGTADTDGTGVATLSYKILEAFSIGAHTLTVEFAGDGNHNASSGTGALNINQAPVKITQSNVVGNLGKAVKLSATLKRYTDNTAMSGKTLRFQVDGADVGTATTNSSGIATLNYTIPATFTTGAHTLAVYFDGSTFYQSGSVTSAVLTVNP